MEMAKNSSPRRPGHLDFIQYFEPCVCISIRGSDEATFRVRSLIEGVPQCLHSGWHWAGWENDISAGFQHRS